MQIASLSPEQLEARFMLEEAPHWWLQSVTRGKKTLGKFREADHYASDEERLLDAWMQLEELLQTIPYGRADVILKKNKSDNVQNSVTLTVQWGNAPQRAGRAAIGSSLAPAHSAGSVTASAQNDGNMLLYMLEMQKEANKREAEAREAAHAREMETMRSLLETKFHAQSLEAEIEGMGQPSLNEELIRSVVDIGKAYLMRPPTLPPAQLGTAGQGSGQVIDPPPPPEVDAEGNRPGERRFSVDLALQHISVVRKNLPEYHINDVLHALALFTQQQPDQAKSTVTMLMQMVDSGR